MSADSGALASVIDAAAPVETSTNDSATVTETPTVETSTETQADVSSTSTKSTEGSDNVEKTPEGTPKESKEVGSITNPSPAQVTKALQAFKDSNPEVNGTLAKQLNNIARREFEYTKEFGSVSEARSVSTLLREVAGIETGQPLTAESARAAINTLQSTQRTAQASDEKLYSGNTERWVSASLT